MAAMMKGIAKKAERFGCDPLSVAPNSTPTGGEMPVGALFATIPAVATRLGDSLGSAFSNAPPDHTFVIVPQRGHKCILAYASIRCG